MTYFKPSAKRVAIATFALAVTAGMAPLWAQTIQDDPYQWLEKLDSKESMQWVNAENAKTLGVLEKDKRFAGFYRDALAIAEARDRIAMPSQLDGKIFNFWQDAKHIKGIWRYTTPAQYQRPAPHWTTVLDLDLLSKKEKTSWVWKGANCEEAAQQRCLISLSDGGEDAVVIREFDIRTAQFVKGGFSIPKGKLQAAWQDKNTLLVSREWQSGALTTSGYPYVVKRLQRGAPLGAAQMVFSGKADDGGYGVTPTTLTDAAGHRALVITRPLSTFEFEKYIITAKGVHQLALPLKSDVVALVRGQLVVKLEQEWQLPARHGGEKFPQGSLVALNLKATEQHPEQLAPRLIMAPGERQSVGTVTGALDALMVESLDNVRGRISVLRPQADGSWATTRISVPDNSSAEIVSADVRGADVFINLSGYLQPPSLWHLNTASGAFKKLKEITPQFDAANYEVQQLEAASSDGVKIPYFVIGPKAMKLTGRNPTILYAYGGFNVSLTPSYMASTGKLWMEQGGVFVVANIRGGGEFGPAWHDAGLKTKRQIIYDDFAAVARDLTARKITDAPHLGIQGGSNGGLLMGVQMTQHPELWSAVDIQVPLLDMLRFESIAAGTSWVGEYGSVAHSDEKKFLAAISPYNNLKKGVNYPQALVWTTTKDDRVGPQHARKFAARLSEFGVPYYFYEVVEGGHGAGANLKETAHTTALEYTYFARQLMHE